MIMSKNIPGAIVALRLKVAERYGVDTAIVLKEINLIEADLTNPNTRVSIEKVLALWQSIIKQTGIYSIGLECGIEARFQTMGILGYVLINSSSILEALEKFCVHQTFVLPLLRQELIFEGEIVKLEGTLMKDWKDGFQYSIDYIVASCWAMIKNSSLHEFKPLAVGFVFPKPIYANRYKDIFENAQINFSCKKNYIVFRKSDVEMPIPLADKNLFIHFDEMLNEIIASKEKINPYTRVTKQIILERLKANIPKIDEVAKAQTISIRSLQQHLQAEGTSFRELLQSVREEVAIQYLSNSFENLGNIAFLLGFSDLASFSRSFKKWTGLSPKEYRNSSN